MTGIVDGMGHMGFEGLSSLSDGGLDGTPGLPERRRIKDTADVLKRSYPELSALQRQEDWDHLSELIHEDYRSGQIFLDNLGSDRYVESKVAMTIVLMVKQ